MPSKLDIEVENVGGIKSDSESITNGVTVLSGQNATNRTSMLQSLMAGLGSDSPPIRAGTVQGFVQLFVDSQEYKRTVKSTESGWHWEGNGAASDIDALETFGFLLEDNPVRQAIRAGDSLYDLVMEPVDTAEIQQEIERLKQKRDRIEERKDSIDDKKDRVHTLETKIESKEDRLEELRQELTDVEASIEDVDQEETQSETLEKSEQINSEIKELSDKKTKLESQIETFEHDLEAKKDELRGLRSGEFEDIGELRDQKQVIKSNINSLRDKQQELEDDRRVLSPLRRFLSQLTHDTTSHTEINNVVAKYSSDQIESETDNVDDVTDLLVQGSADTHCILCGNEMGGDEYEHLLNDVSSIINTIDEENDDIEARISELESEKSDVDSHIREIRQNKDRIDTLQNDINKLTSDIDEKEDELATVESELSDAKDRRDKLEHEAIDATEDASDELRDLERQKTEIEVEINQLESDIENHQSEKEELETEIDKIEVDVHATLPEVENKLTSLRGKVESIEDSIVEQFNEQMDDLISRLSFENIERIWLEKKIITVKEGRKKVEKTAFDLHIVREVDGKATEDVIDNLSESEREITGIIFALTGFIVHDVADSFPVVLMDSVEMIDAHRLEALLRYIEPHVDFLVVAALPEDTDAMSVGSVIEKGNPQPVSN
jgi:predicted  nucleic acid-binding Zn-ribbon protein